MVWELMGLKTYVVKVGRKSCVHSCESGDEHGEFHGHIFREPEF